MVSIVGANKSSTLGLIQAFEGTPDTPTKSSLSEKRKTVSYRFFEDIFKKQVCQFSTQLPTWKGLHVVATDGDNYILPAIGDALDKDYRGSVVKGHREGYYPRMYVSTLYDVLSGTLLGFNESSKNDELSRAMDLKESLPWENTVMLYDRYYFSRRLVTEHMVHGSYFLCRLKTGETVLSEVKDFIASRRRNLAVDIEGVEVHLIRVKNSKTGKDSFFATNMKRSNFRNKEVLELYSRRWDIETSFRDLTETMKMESWHSHSINGIKQEIFVTLWIFNQIKMWEFSQSPRSWHKVLKREYERPCFKSILLWFMNHFIELCQKLTARAWREFKMIIERTKERRKRLSRAYPRTSKRPTKKYSRDALIQRRA